MPNQDNIFFLFDFDFELIILYLCTLKQKKYPVVNIYSKLQSFLQMVSNHRDFHF